MPWPSRYVGPLIPPKEGLDTLFFSNILALAWTLLLPAKSSKGRLDNHFNNMEFQEEILLSDNFGDDDGGESIDVDKDEEKKEEENAAVDDDSDDDDGEEDLLI